MFIRENGGKYYVCRRTCGAGGLGSRGRKAYRDWFLIKYHGHGVSLNIGNISIPKKFLGKKIRLTIELVKNRGR